MEECFRLLWYRWLRAKLVGLAFAAQHDILRLGKAKESHSFAGSLVLDVIPGDEERVVVRNLPCVFLGALVQLVRLAEEKERFSRQIIQQSTKIVSNSLGLLATLHKEAQFACGWHRDRIDLLTRDLS